MSMFSVLAQENLPQSDSWLRTQYVINGKNNIERSWLAHPGGSYSTQRDFILYTCTSQPCPSESYRVRLSPLKVRLELEGQIRLELLHSIDQAPAWPGGGSSIESGCRGGGRLPLGTTGLTDGTLWVRLETREDEV